MKTNLRATIARLRSRVLRETPTCKYHNRGLTRFDDVLRSTRQATLTDQIHDRLQRTPTLSVLELGCGEGRLLLDLLARFGNRIVVHGVNHPQWRVVAHARGLRASNQRHGILAPADLARLPLPTIHLVDAQDLSCFGDGSFDLVISQVMVAHVARKDRVLEESARVLAPGGAFILEIDRLDPERPDFMDDDLPRFRIYDDDVKVSTTAHLRARGIDLRQGCRDDAVVFATYAANAGRLDLALRFDALSTILLKSVQTSAVAAHLWGVRSVFHVDRAAATGRL